MKPGVKTSEFWVAVIGALLAGFAKANLLPGHFPQEAFVVLAAYVISRGMAKLATPGTRDSGTGKQEPRG